MTGSNKEFRTIVPVSSDCSFDPRNRRRGYTPQNIADREIARNSRRIYGTVVSMILRIVFLTIGTALVLAGVFLDRKISCSTEVATETSYTFGNACQDQLFGAQMILVILGAVIIGLAASIRSK